MDDMRERLARRLYDVLEPRKNERWVEWEELADWYKAGWLKAADALKAELRVPDEAMEKAGDDCDEAARTNPHADPAPVRYIWQAMTDAIGEQDDG